jgi:hypothetical protein
MPAEYIQPINDPVYENPVESGVVPDPTNRLFDLTSPPPLEAAEPTPPRTVQDSPPAPLNANLTQVLGERDPAKIASTANPNMAVPLLSAAASAASGPMSSLIGGIFGAVEGKAGRDVVREQITQKGELFDKAQKQQQSQFETGLAQNQKQFDVSAGISSKNAETSRISVTGGLENQKQSIANNFEIQKGALQNQSGVVQNQRLGLNQQFEMANKNLDFEKSKWKADWDATSRAGLLHPSQLGSASSGMSANVSYLTSPYARRSITVPRAQNNSMFTPTSFVGNEKKNWNPASSV